MRKQFQEIRNRVNFKNKRCEESMQHMKVAPEGNLEIKLRYQKLQAKWEYLAEHLRLQEIRIVQCEQ